MRKLNKSSRNLKFLVLLLLAFIIGENIYLLYPIISRKERAVPICAYYFLYFFTKSVINNAYKSPHGKNRNGQERNMGIWC